MSSINDFERILKEKLTEAEAAVNRLKQEMTVMTSKLIEAQNRMKALTEVFKYEVDSKGIAYFQSPQTIQNDKTLFHIEPPFKNITIREACRMILQEKGSLHIKDIQKILSEGGKEVGRTSITSILIRGKEFEKVEGKQNTFKLKDEGVINVVK